MSVTQAVEATVTEQSGDRFQTINALLLALVTLIGAFVAWRASVAGDGSGDAAVAGLLATLNAEETRAINYVSLYENYRGYTAYTRYDELGNQLDLAADTAGSEEEATQLDRQMREAWDTAESFYFPHRYLQPDGNYDTGRELGEAWAEAARQKDLNPEPQFQEADRMAGKSNWLIGIVTVLAVALLAHTLAEMLSGAALKYALMACGVILMLGGIAATVAVEYYIFP